MKSDLRTDQDLPDLYPPLEPLRTGHLQVSALHSLYYEEVGNPNGSPVVFLHGGPGAGVLPDYRRFFDPKHYRVILFDQRGAGRSTPHAELNENTTWDLVSDIEKLREHFGIKKWIVFGGSWGSTLALVYAIAHPERTLGLCLRGIFLCRPQELKWFYQEGAHRLFPDAWEPYWNHIPESERGDMISAYYKILTHPDPNIRLEAARRWSVWEASTSKLVPDPTMEEAFAVEEFALAFARIECHYFINNIFTSSTNHILENAHRLKGIPGQIVHGRYDVVCPVENAWDLKKAWPEAHLHIVGTAGHSAMEDGIRRRLVQIMDNFRSL